MEEHNEKDDWNLNKYTFFVNDNPTGDWIRLPDIQPHLITQSKNIKYLLTGDLNRRLVTNPEFDGREKEYLRVLIARIMHSTTICPEGLWDKDDENNINMRDDETRDVKGTNDLNTPENWIWLRPCILPSGNLKAKEVEEDLDDPENKDKEPKETTVDRLTKIEMDLEKDNWKFAVKGLNDVHKIEGRDVS